MPNLGLSSETIGEWRVLSGPAILRISVLLIIAGMLAALVQFLLPAEPPATVAEPPTTAREARPVPPPDAPPPAAPVAEPEPVQARRAAPPPARMPDDALAFPPSAAAPSASSPATQPPIPAAPVPAAPTPPPRGEAEIARAEESAGPRALALVDLNTAPVADLNRLQGGGSIGRAIVSKRPYASVDQLLSKRVLSRAVYDRIREQVTVR